MVRTLVSLLASLSFTAVGWTAVYTVQITDNGGTGSLRWAMNEANDHAGPDTIRFAPALSGQTIQPKKPLPTLMDDETTINGDIDGDGKPDITLNGRRQDGETGLLVAGDRCVVAGLAVVRFGGAGIFLATAADCRIRSCHVGVNLPGTREVRNEEYQIALFFAHNNQIGDGIPAHRNVISGGSDAEGGNGIVAMSSMGNTIKGNYIGVTRSGMAVLGDGGAAIMLYTFLFGPGGGVPLVFTDRPALIAAEQNVIGGTTPAERNVIAGVNVGVALYGAMSNVIQGNYFGLARDGETGLGTGMGVYALYGSANNLIGGTSPGARNVFAKGVAGVIVAGEGSQDNKVQGNYFGLTASGTAQRRMQMGVAVMQKAGPQMIGGNTAKAGNYFTTKPTTDSTGIALQAGGSGIVIRHNKFGVRPDGTDATPSAYAIRADSTSAEILDNTIARGEVGIGLGGSSVLTTILRNRIRRCDVGVHLTGNTRCLLGDLGNASDADDGGNTFVPSNTWHIRNDTIRLVKAEGNDFKTTSRAAINAKIWDRRDNPALGRVDFSPLLGGVLPTGTALVVTGALGLPTPAGAEIVFTLSAPARVSAQVVNIAGRPVASVARGASLEAGRQRLIWSGQSSTGTPVPNGTYFVRIAGTSAEGEQANALTRVTLQR